jgi:LysM repeat protein
MRGRSAIFVFASVLAIIRPLGAAEPEVQFTGVLVADGKTKVALTDKTTGTTKWIAAGADYHGYIVSAYDPKTDVITVKKSGQEYRLPLVTAKAGTSISPAVIMTPTNPSQVAPNSVPANPPLEPTGTVGPTTPTNPGPPPPTQLTTSPALTPGAPGEVTNAPAPSVASQSANDALMPLQYTVKPGDTFARISAESGVTVEQLQALNPTINPTTLRPGQTIRTR